jgi:hypothetical protein
VLRAYEVAADKNGDPVGRLLTTIGECFAGPKLDGPTGGPFLPCGSTDADG